MGTVIKAGSAAKLKKRFQHLVLDDHLAEARAVLLAARDRARDTVEQAESDAAVIREQAREEGYREGFARGQRDGEAAGRDEALAQAKEAFRRDQEHLVAHLNALIAEFESRKHDLVERAQRDLLAFALAIAERITQRTAALDREVVAANVARAVQHVGDWTDLILRVHPDDAAAIRMYAGRILHEFHETRHISVVEERGIGRGGCILETSQTCVDATLEAQFAEVVELLLGQRDTEHGAGELPGGEVS